MAATSRDEVAGWIRQFGAARAERLRDVQERLRQTRDPHLQRELASEATALSEQIAHARRGILLHRNGDESGDPEWRRDAGAFPGLLERSLEFGLVAVESVEEG
jgi:hypothetical protein